MYNISQSKGIKPTHKTECMGDRAEGSLVSWSKLYSKAVSKNILNVTHQGTKL